MKTIRVTDPQAPPFSTVRPGDTVIVETVSGQRARFVVKEVARDALVSEDGVRYAHADMVRVQRRTLSAWKTGLVIGGAAWIGLHLWLAVASS